MSTLGDKLRCPHCLEEIDNLENPKQLPCNHIYCSPCLETLTETVQTGVIITCSICSGSHHAINLAVLADINPPQSDNQMNDKPSQEDTWLVFCDKCEGAATPAVCYCAECDRKLCRKHEEIHQQYFCEKMAFPHKLISIETYNLRPNFYTKPPCKLHGHEYTMCCRHCLCLKCKSCTVADDCKVETKHFYQTMEDTTQQLKEEFYALSKECSDCITNMCRQEKETWLKLDEIEEECENLMYQVRKKTEHLVSELWKEHDRLKERVQSYESQAKDKVETYLGKLRVQREQLGETREECSRFVRDSHVTQIIAEREKRVSQLQETQYTQLDGIPDMLLLRGSLQGFLDLPSPSFPKNINYLYQRETKNQCFSASFDAAGSLYICSTGGLDIYQQYEGTGSRKKIDTGIITSVGFEPGTPNVYYIKSPHDKQLVYKYTPSSADPIELFTYEYPGNNAPFLTVSGTYIAATANRSLILYNIRKGKQVSRELEFQPAKVCFLSTSYLLTTSTPENRLYMFKIRDTEDMELTTVWICHDLKGADGLCMTKDNVIVVKAEKGGALYLVSTQGTLINTLYHSGLESAWGGIYVRENLLVTPCPKQNKYKMFSLE